MIVDSNVLLHLINPNDPASEAVSMSFGRVAAKFDLKTNHVIFAEVSPVFSDAAEVAAILTSLNIELVGLTQDDAFRAGTAFREYRRNGGPRNTVLPDFLIGAQASVRGWPIFTRDTKHFSSYFPEVELIDPMQVQHD
jgi:predicted nucleic acid-binding protein